MIDLESLKYPVGKFVWSGSNSDSDRMGYIAQIAETPANLRAAVNGLNNEQLDTPYRPDGWTVRQVVHHLPDSHMNAYIRFKLAVTEDQPTIKTYNEARWAELPDAKVAPVEVSLALLENLHSRWVTFLKSLPSNDFSRTLKHPELGAINLEKYVALYAWHSRHHVAHIMKLRNRNDW